MTRIVCIPKPKETHLWNSIMLILLALIPTRSSDLLLCFYIHYYDLQHKNELIFDLKDDILLTITDDFFREPMEFCAGSHQIGRHNTFNYFRTNEGNYFLRQKVLKNSKLKLRLIWVKVTDQLQSFYTKIINVSMFKNYSNDYNFVKNLWKNNYHYSSSTQIETKFENNFTLVAFKNNLL